MAVEIWLGLFCARFVSANTKWHWRDCTCVTARRHILSQPRPQELPSGRLGTVRPMVFNDRNSSYDGHEWGNSQHFCFWGVKTVISSWCFTVPFFGSKCMIGFSATTVAYNTTKCQGLFLWSYSADFYFLRQKQWRRTGCSIPIHKSCLQEMSFFAFQNILPLKVENLHNTSGDFSKVRSNNSWSYELCLKDKSHVASINKWKIHVI